MYWSAGEIDVRTVGTTTRARFKLRQWKKKLVSLDQKLAKYVAVFKNIHF